MPTCPKGHDSETADYCDICGSPMAHQASAAATSPAPRPPVTPSPPEPAEESCPVCGTARSGRFCEADGYDFLTASLGGAKPAAAARKPDAPVPAGAWVVVASADRVYFDTVRAMGGADADDLSYPRFAPQRRFPIGGDQVTIGRRSRSRGIYPDIDLVGPPEDPGVSHLHALLVAQPDSTWAVVDLDSANGTYLNDPSAPPIKPHEPIHIANGDAVYLGAWTKLILNRPT